MPLPYPKGNLQVWHLKSDGFTNGSNDAKAILALGERPLADGRVVVGSVGSGAAKEDDRMTVRVRPSKSGQKFFRLRSK